MQNNSLAVNNSGGRIEYIDTFRTIGIILMIMGHVGFGSVFDKWIHAFNMPMFFFISGWFFRDKSNNSFYYYVIKKIKKLLVPYFIFGSIVFIISVLFIKGFDVSLSLKQFLWNNTGGYQPIPGALWFLTSIFFVEIIYYILNSTFTNKLILTIVISIISITTSFFAPVFYNNLPWALSSSLIGIGFFHLAVLINKSELKNKRVFNPIIIFVAGVIISVSVMFNKYVNIRTGLFQYTPLFWINAIVSIIIGWNISIYFDKFIHNKLNSFFSRIIHDIGKNSIVYLCLNQLIIVLIRQLMGYYDYFILYKSVIVFFITIIILIVLEKIICTTKLNGILGNW